MTRQMSHAQEYDAWEQDDAYEPTYPDGTVRHECWNAKQIARKQPLLRQKKAVLAEEEQALAKERPD